MTAIAMKSREYELEEYLKDLGLKDFVKTVRESGVTSLQFLKTFCASQARKDALADKILAETSGSGQALAAEIVKALTPEEVQKRIDAIDTKNDGPGSKAFDEKKQQLAEAIREVEALRQECLKDARESRETVSKNAKSELADILAAANARELMKFGDDAFATAKGAAAALERVQQQLQSKITDELGTYLNKKKLGEPELLEKNQILKGFCLTATELRRASGSNLLDMGCEVIEEAQFNGFDYDYSSEEAYGSARRMLESSASSFATSNRVRGAMFMGSGIGAASAVGNYARASQKRRDEADAQRTQQATKLKVHYLWSQQALVRIPTNKFVLSREAVDALQAIDASGTDERRGFAVDFLAAFGSHVFCTSVLGGWYKHVAKATCRSKERMASLDEALSSATNWAVSASASYVGLAGIGSVASANERGVTAASATSSALSCTVREQQVAIATSVFGGLPELPSELWRVSVKPNAHWQVIDRQDEVPVWKVLGYARLPTPAFDRKRMAALLEEVWINEIFVPSIEAGAIRTALLQEAPKTVDALTRAIERLTAEPAAKPAIAPPVMKLASFRKLPQSLIPMSGEHATELSMELPAGYKILCGGVHASAGAERFLVASFPSIGANGRWRWTARLRSPMAGPPGIAFQNMETICVLAVYDPNDEWDVRLLHEASLAKDARQTLTVRAAPGDLLTGVGGEIDQSSNAFLAACGFAEPVGVGGRDAVVSSTELNYPCPHHLKATAIAVRAKNGAALEPHYQLRPFASSGHHNHSVAHNADLAEGVPRSTMIGGGARVEGGWGNCLQGSAPIGDGAWHAASRDYINAYPRDMSICTLGVNNVEIAAMAPALLS